MQRQNKGNLKSMKFKYLVNRSIKNGFLLNTTKTKQHVKNRGQETHQCLGIL